MSSQRQHTPGPFEADYNTEDLRYRIVSKVTQGNVGYAYTEADAALFAAAPELLAALEKFVTRAEDLAPLDTGPLIEARRAIAKARGEA